jgi:asparagine synthase (glutamine-hydrolysing)
MCGIAGYLRLDGPGEHSVVKAMCDTIRHRGPDDEGFHVEQGCAIGMRRLSIIDLHTGHQPISNEDGTVWVVFNGEIYNYQELRDRVRARGHRLKTNTDTEVLLHLYEDEGVESIARLRGMFAYCIWDSRRQRITVVRDRFGKKPVYYANLPGGLYFGSEIKCLMAAGVPRDIDPEGLRLYFQFTQIPDPYTAYRSIRKLEPGCWLTYDTQGRFETGRYWRLPPPTEEEPAGFDPERACEELRTIFDESVAMRMIADVPLGAFLSGGIDSSLVVASMARQSPDPIKTFSIGFEEAAFNELGYAKLVAEKYKTDHHEILVRPNSLELTQKLIRHFDEPFADSSAIPTYIVSEFARRHVTVALSGDGGDELFAGYESFQLIDKLRPWDRLPMALRKLSSAVAERLPYSAFGKNYLYMLGRPSALERYFQFNYAPYLLRRELLQPEWMLPADGAFLTKTFVNNLLPEGADVLSQALYFEATAKLTGDMLVKVDRMSMAASLEVRCPLLDHRLAEWAATIPTRYKLRDGKGKHILLRALGDRLPPELLNRPKMGFAIPLGDWINGPLRELVHDQLLRPSFLDRGIVSRRVVQNLIDEHARKRRDNHTWIWTLLVLSMWFDEVDLPAATYVRN